MKRRNREGGDSNWGERNERKRKWNDTLGFLKEERRKRSATINENCKTRATISAWHFGYPSASGEGNVLETL